MNRLLVSLVAIVGLAVMAPTGAAATEPAPGKPLDTHTSSGTGCVVADADGVRYDDPNCAWHREARIGPDRAIVRFQYFDHGQLPAHAAFPKRTIRITHFVPCQCPGDVPLTETITPSGEYKSSCDYRAGSNPIYWPEGEAFPSDPRGNSGR